MLELVINRHPTPDTLLHRFTRTLLAITQASSHTHEATVHRLLQDMGELYNTGTITHGEYEAIIGTAADVADFFHYDIEHLAGETNPWYRASLIHQIGQGMLQAVEKLRPELSACNFFAEALNGLGMGKAGAGGRPAPLTCRPWAQDIQPIT